jgi:uncharacterized membrane protein
MQWTRIGRHLAMPAWRSRLSFPQAMLARIEAAIRRGEQTHLGQIRFVVEASLDLPLLLRGVTARERAVDVFSMLRVWDTQNNNGVLIYLLLADHDVEIVADRGIHAHVGTSAWESICQDMERSFRARDFEQGVLTGIAAASRLLAEHYPGQGENELPDAPVLM